MDDPRAHVGFSQGEKKNNDAQEENRERKKKPAKRKKKTNLLSVYKISYFPWN